MTERIKQRLRKKYLSPDAKLFCVEQKLSYLSYFSGDGSIDQWDMAEDELKFERVN